ncbi:hypothetical protein FD03_GL001861 [Companilactobacillus nodensis DSM 19682 = JCM 14932 = NBRC 107160]|uniref:Surface layer protein A domain-containing protein n=1 Tax=Companilactobacillus nodensis DSM 19682 = JCM 14932 = NBRC 107160 TaxID=1423775 RepID=A0A0R1KAS0_9LACO|nr:hypothetical protein FD03_GL001861 [Companilactobacillus nodensis DSM 19682 = JCM 14932 = NBRC 107160]
MKLLNKYWGTIVKKSILAITMALIGCTLTSVNITKASEKTYTFEAAETIFMKSDSPEVAVHKMENGKIIKTNDKADIYDAKGTPKLWRANSVNVNGKDWWQVSENEYFNTKGSEKLDKSNIADSSENGIKYANYTPDLPNYDGKDIVFIAADPKSDNMTIDLYKDVNGKLVNTGKSVNAAKGFSAQYWKANKVNVNGQDCWQVGENLYFNSPQVKKLDLVHNDTSEITNYGNYSDGDTKSEVVNEIFLFNGKGDYVPVMELQNDGSFTKIDNRELKSNTNWKIDKIRNYNSKIYARVATNEWIDVTDYAVQNQKNYIN